MGNTLNTFYCKSCDPNKLDNAQLCIDKLLAEENPEKGCEEIKAEKLRCRDKAHSIRKQLTIEHFNELVDELNGYLKQRISPLPCEQRKTIMLCLDDNPGELLNCKDEMDQFINCVDALRITTIKRQIEEMRAEKLRNKYKT